MGSPDFRMPGDIEIGTPADTRFPNPNQARHCYMRYNEFFRCQAKHGEGADQCSQMKKFYARSAPTIGLRSGTTSERMEPSLALCSNQLSKPDVVHYQLFNTTYACSWCHRLSVLVFVAGLIAGRVNPP